MKNSKQKKTKVDKNKIRPKTNKKQKYIKKTKNKKNKTKNL